MLGKVNYVTPNENNRTWKLDNLGFGFEDHIVAVIENALRSYYQKGLTIEPTPMTNDQGKDIIVRSPVSFSLFGKRFRIKSGKEMTIYLEIKSSHQKSVSLDHFAKNILAANRGKIDYFVLITNSTVVPYSYCELDRNATENNYDFYLVDQHILAEFLIEQNAICGNYCAPETKTDVSISYQINYGNQEGIPYLELYLLFRNNTFTPQVCRFQLKSDRNWMLSETKFEVFLDGRESRCRCIGVKKAYFDGIDDIVIRIDFNNQSKTVVINGDAVDYEFETPLVGKKHKAQIAEIVALLRENTALQLINIQGEAGIGKTRILQEVTKKVVLNGIEVIHHVCSSNSSAVETLLDHLRHKFPQHKIKNLSDLTHIPVNFKRYAIIIEDIHNADTPFFTALKELMHQKSTHIPFSIITAGRDDYTVYNPSFFSFLNWLRDESASLHCKSYIIEKLTNEECKYMVQAIIRGAPQAVIEKIHHCSENNPFYVCQFIEYLLETKLIYLINRNTVGIANVTSFAAQVYIPKSIEALLEKRFDLLMQVPDGKQLQTFLMILAFYGIKAPVEIYHLFFADRDPGIVETLYRHHFLAHTYDDQIIFDHENIFLFIRKKLSSAKAMTALATLLSKNPDLFALYPDKQKAISLFHSGQIEECKAFLKPAEKELFQITNISSCNLNPHHIDLYEIIYQIACNEGNDALKRKTLLAWMYVALHNQSIAMGLAVFEHVFSLIRKNHKSDIPLILSAKQLQAHLFLKSDRISQAKKLLLELAAQERETPDLFDDETRFDLFDRLASIYAQENHKAVALSYNQLSIHIAEKLHDKKLITLSKITKAKLCFYDDTANSLTLMNSAKELLHEDMSPRIHCHNNLGILTARLLIDYPTHKPLSQLVKNGNALLKDAMTIEYPAAMVRSHYLMAVIHYLSQNDNSSLDLAEAHLEAGIADSIRNGIAKLMPSLYCMSAIVAARRHAPTENIYQLFQTMLQHMRQCDQFFLGALDFTYSNIILLTNYAVFLCEYGLESEIYQFLSEIKYYGSNIACDFKCDPQKPCYYVCQRNMEVFTRNYQRVSKGELLFIEGKHRYPLRDQHTPFYIPLGV